MESNSKIMEDFRQKLESNPNDLDVLYDRGLHFFRLGEYDESRKDFTKFLSLAKEAGVFLNRGMCFFRQRRYVEAIEDFSVAIRMDRKDSRFWMMRGSSYFELQELKKAIDDFTCAISCDPRSSRGYVNRGSVYDELGDFENSIQEYTEAVKVNPKDFFAYNNRGNAYKNLGRLEQAISDLSQAISLNPKYYSAYNNRGVVRDLLEEYKTAIEDFNVAIQLNPKRPEAYTNRGNVFDKMGESEKALQDYSSSIRTNPRHYLAYYNRGILYNRVGECDKAFRDYTATIKLNPKYWKALFNRGNSCRRLGDYKGAIGDYDESIRLNPNDFFSYGNRGYVYYLLGEYKKSREDLEASIRLNPTDEYSLCHLGRLLVELGELRQGMKYFKSAVDNNSTSAGVYYSRAEVFSSIEEERAIEDYFRLMDIQRGERPGKKFDVSGKVEEIFKGLSAKLDERNIWFPFLEDQRSDEELEKREVELLKELVRSKIFDETCDNPKTRTTTKLKLFRFLGRGASCSTYLVRISGILNIFVLKVIHDFVLGKKEKKKMKDRDCVFLPYHRNIAITLSNFDEHLVLPKETFPDFNPEKHFWKLRVPGQVIRTPLILMKYYRKTLEKYISQRKSEKASFTPLEMCYMLRGLLEGIRHLHKNGVVHRDLHTENVFVDEAYGRIFIGDFGCCLDCRSIGDDKEDGFQFKVNIGEEPVPSSLFGSSTSSSSSSSSLFDGDVRFLSPEVVDFVFEEGIFEFVDFEKNDLFSVGMLGYSMIDSFVNKLVAPFGTFLDYCNDKEEEHAVCEGRKQENYVPLKYYSSTVSGLIEKLLKVNPLERIGFDESLEELDKIQGEEELNVAIRMSMENSK